MSTPAMVPMFSPDGARGDIPADKVDAATQAGFQLAHEMKSPDGSVGYIPHNKLGDALQAKFLPTNASEAWRIATSTQGPQSPQQPQQPGAISRFATNALQALGIPSSMDEVRQRTQQEQQRSLGSRLGEGAVRAVVGPAYDLAKSQPYSGENLTNIRDAYQRSGGMSNGASGIPNAVPYAIAGAVPFIGSTIQKGMKQAETGDYAGAAGTGAGIVLPAVVGASLEGKLAASSSGGVLPKVPMSELPVERAQAVTRAINPDPEVAQQFQKNFAQAAPDIQAAAQKNGIPLETNRAGGIKLTEQGGIDVRQHLADATRAAADQHKNYYYETFINPIQDEAVQVGADPRSKMTIGAMDRRLSDINALLNPKYDKGGAAARAALAPDQTVALQAEAAQLRHTMNDYVAWRFGLSPEDIAGQRQRFGVLYDIEDKVRQSTNDAQYYKNDAARNPSINPFSKKFIADRAVRAVLPNPDAAIGGAFNEQLVPRDVPRPTQTPPPLNNYPPRVPLWNQPQGSQPSPTILDTQLPQSANASAFQSRAADVSANNAAVANARDFLRQQIEQARRARLSKQGR